MPDLPPLTERNLLFGILAVREGMVSAERAFEVLVEWQRERGDHLLADYFEQLGVIDRSSRVRLETLIAATIAAKSHPANDTDQTVGPDGNGGIDLKTAESDFSDNTIVAEPGTLLGSSFRSETADAAGRYRVLRLHSAGAMGEVFVAVDGEFGREVALKQIRDRFSENRQQQARFVLEAEITGSLEHPGVVPVYSLGKYKDGRPFYAMRLIRGDSLKEAIVQFHRRPSDNPPPVRKARRSSNPDSKTIPVQDASDKAAKGYRGAVEGSDAPNGARLLNAMPDFHSLAFRSLMRRFVDVCNAIGYAHSRGVLHRDLKPGNIMLGDFGETLVVDWGLAKLLGKTGAEDPDSLEPIAALPHDGICIEQTRPGAAVGTPAYMSPEQAEGKIDQLGPAADIYSLGATLYTIVTGRSPFDRKDIVDTLNEVRFGKFRPPRAVQPRIPKPLEAICLKAMALRADDRYKSSLDLAGDIERWLADEPVLALAESAFEKARRWMRKHPGVVAGVAATVLVGLGGLWANFAIVSDKNRILERQQGELAQANADLSRANTDLQSANREQAAARQRAQIKEREARSLVDDWFTAVSESRELKQTPNTQSLRKGLLKRAKEYYENVVRENAVDDDTLGAVAAANYRLGYVTDEISPGPEALEAYQRSLSIRRKLFAAHPERLDYAVDFAKTSLNVGKLLAATGKSTEARQAFADALAVQGKLAVQHPEKADYAGDLAAIHNNIALLELSTGKIAEALAAHRFALEVLERAAKLRPDDVALTGALAATHGNIGNLMLAVANVPLAIEAYEKASRIYGKLTADHPAATEYANALAATHGNVGNLMFATGKTDQALSSYHAALSLYEKLSSQNPTVTRFASYLADTQNNIGLVQQARGAADEARRAFERALSIYDRLAKENPSVMEFRLGLGGSRCNIGSLEGQVGNPAKAIATLNTAVDTLAAVLAATPGHVQTMQFLRNAHLGRARTYARLKQIDQCLADFDAALRLADARTAEEIRKERNAAAKQ